MGLLDNVGGVRFDPILNHNFLITLVETSSTGMGILSAGVSAVTDMLLGGFSECSGLESTLNTFEIKQGGDNGKTLHFPDRIQWTDIVLKRGVGLFSSPSDPLPVGISLWDWHYSFIKGKGKRRDGIIILQNEMKIPYNIWMFRQGLPTKYSGPTLNAMENRVAIEQLTIAHHGLYQLPFVSEAAGIATAIVNKVASG